MDSSGLCKCIVCAQAEIVQAAYIRRRIWQLTGVGSLHPVVDFSELDILLNILNTTPVWFEHLVSCVPTFSLMCDGESLSRLNTVCVIAEH